MNIDIGLVVQTAIALGGGTAIYLIAKKRRFGFMLGLLTQPFWLYSSYSAKQWGILALCVWYTYSYWIGWRDWDKEPATK
jgi:hypothetical protein